MQDISARSPVPPEPTTPRQSLDSRMTRPLRSSIKDLERPQPTDEEAFEDVGLNDEAKQQQPAKKRGLFARFGDNFEAAPSNDGSRPTSSHRGFHLPGRKRGQSGQGAELGNIDRPPAPATKEPEEDGMERHVDWIWMTKAHRSSVTEVWDLVSLKQVMFDGPFAQP
ncbi:MAG: hypothetical protein Q9201_002446 [Fulgogasparrea decipioides]